MVSISSKIRKIYRQEREKWAAELRFLGQTLPWSSAPRKPAGIETLGRLDWDKFHDVLKRHRLLPLATHYLRLYRDIIPVETAARIENSWRRDRLRLLALAKEQVALMAELQQAGIRALPLKGPALAQQLYGDPTARQSADLDLLVHPEDLKRAAEYLVAQGYRSVDGYAELYPRQQQAFLNRYHDFGFRHTQRAIQVELHWRFFETPSYFSLPLEDRLFCSHQVSFGGTVLSTLPPEVTLLYLCAHGAQHLWFRLLWAGDIAALLAQKEPVWGWPKLLDRAQELGVRTALIEGVTLASLLCRYEIPEPIWEAANRTPCLPKMLKTVCRAIAQPRDSPFAGNRMLYYKAHRHMLRLHQGPKAKADYCRNLLCSQISDWQTLKLPPKLFFLYALLRPVFWLRRQFACKP
jgi:hypothetical protein